MRLGDYRLLKQIGAGPDGIAYRARSENEQRTVEVHELGLARKNPQRWYWLLARLRIAATYTHPAVIRVLELATEHDPPYVVRQHAGERTLAEQIRERGALGEAEALPLAQLLAGAVSASHSLGLVHGRIQPSQVWLDENHRPKLDFTGAEVHTPRQDALIQTLDMSCRAPEILEGSTPYRPADVYCLGALLACSLSGRPWTETTRSADGRTILETSPAIGALIRELTVADPDDRPPAQEVVQRLAALLGQFEGTGEWQPHDTKADCGSSYLELGTIELSQPPSSSPGPAQETVGRFRLLELLGEGGQGAVYRAQDRADNSIVALKILRTDRAQRPEALKRFRKEARLLAESNNPYVVNLLEFSDEDNVPYLVLEFVAGKNLSDLISERKRLDEMTALEIMADVARALAGPHERGIVHRDVKPANILLPDSTAAPAGCLAETLADSDEARGPRSRVIDGVHSGTSIRVKLSDFGLARHVIDTESMALTAAGALLGTPHYMAPEQWNGTTIDARTDVYAMGATLFHLLAGRPPFLGTTRDELLAQHCREPIPALGRFNPSVSEGTSRVVEKAMAKRPEDRYPNAVVLLRDLEALRLGTPSALELHPLLPACDPGAVITFDWAWELDATPRQIWPHVSNTERVNRALGLAAPDFSTRIAPDGNVERYAGFRRIVPFQWREHPFEWIEGQRFGVLREFQQGVFHWFLSRVELQPRSGGGTRLVHQIKVLPRGIGGRLLAHLELGRKGRRALERVYQRIDAVCTGKLSARAVVDPFEEPPRLAATQRLRLEQGLERLEQHGVEGNVVDLLGEFLSQAPDPEVARIRPLALARRLGLDPEQIITACLHGACEGLLVLLWDLICPVCRISSKVEDTLRAIRDHGHCPACNLDYPLDFANAVELVFRAHPEIRQVDLKTYCIGGPAHFPHVLAQVRVAPGERVELSLQMTAGSYRVRGPQLPWTADLQVQSHAPVRTWEVNLATGPSPDDPRTLAAGHQVLTFTSQLDREILVRVERVAARDDALTASRAASLALFRQLFPDEVLSPGQLATVSTVSLMAVQLDPAQADILYQELGDSRAFNVIHELFQLLDEAVRESGGAVVKTVGEGLLAAFDGPASAVQLGLQLPARLKKGEMTRNLRLRIGIHRGTALAANINDHLDYFGATSRQVMKFCRHARDGELVLSPGVSTDIEVAALLKARGLEPSIELVESLGLPYVARIAVTE
jgi:serine/threonine protein kinase/class 3 adenylate cyclase